MIAPAINGRVGLGSLVLAPGGRYKGFYAYVVGDAGQSHVRIGIPIQRGPKRVTHYRVVRRDRLEEQP